MISTDVEYFMNTIQTDENIKRSAVGPEWKRTH